jgi:hypothetical protein
MNFPKHLTYNKLPSNHGVDEAKTPLSDDHDLLDQLRTEINIEEGFRDNVLLCGSYFASSPFALSGLLLAIGGTDG